MKLSRSLLLFALAVSAAVALGSGATPARAASASLPAAVSGYDYKACLPRYDNTGVQHTDGVYVHSYQAPAAPSNMTMGSLGDNYWCVVGNPQGSFGTHTFDVTVRQFIPGSPPTLGGVIDVVSVTMTTLFLKWNIEGPSEGTAGQPFTTRTQIYTDPGAELAWQSSVVGGSFPAGLSMSGNGVITGTPTQPGTYTFTVQYDSPAVGWANSSRPRRDFTLTIKQGIPPVSLATSTLAATTAYTPYQQTVAASAGTAPYTFALAGGALPPGLTMSPAGVILGTATKAGTYTFTVSVRDARGTTASKSYTITVTWPELEFSPAVLVPATQGKRYTARLVARKGMAPYTYSLKAGRLPRGLVLSSSGVITGIAKVYGTFTFTVGVVDANGAPGEETWVLKVKKAPKVKTKRVAGR